MAENLAQEIRAQEAAAKTMIADAKAEAARIVAAAHAEAEQSLKDTKQRCHRQWRESVANAEKEAEIKAGEILSKGEKEAKKLYDSQKDAADKVADWLAKEVTAVYGSRRNV